MCKRNLEVGITKARCRLQLDLFLNERLLQTLVFEVQLCFRGLPSPLILNVSLMKEEGIFRFSKTTRLKPIFVITVTFRDVLQFQTFVIQGGDIKSSIGKSSPD